MTGRSDHPAQDHLVSILLEKLFDRVRKSDGTQYTLREVADEVTRMGTPISHAYIGYLRRGERTDPTIGHLRGLAAFFGVPVEYFITPEVADAVDKELVLASTLQDLQARSVALRESVVPGAEAAIDTMTRLLEVIRDIEKARGAADESR